MNPLTKEMVDRAVAIADEAMVSAVESFGVPSSDPDDRWGPADQNGAEVQLFEQASEDLREAVDWLVLRGIARVERDDVGEFVVVDHDKIGQLGTVEG